MQERWKILMTELTLEELADFLRHTYGYRLRSAQRLSPVWRLETDLGPLCLKKVCYEEDKLQYICLAMAHLNQQGFNKSPVLLPTLQGSYYAFYRGHRYFLTDWVADIPCDFGEREHIFAATATLAEFHQYSRGLETPPDLYRRPHWERWIRTLSRRTEDLRRYRVKLEKSPLLPLLNEQILQAETALNILENSQYRAIARRAKKLGTFIHRDVAARNFVLDYKGQAKIIDFDYCRWDIRLVDLARLLDRTLRSHRWRFGFARAILETYDEITPIFPEEYPVLLGLLYFPQRFWRLCHRYYESGTLECVHFLSNLRALQSEKTTRMRFLRILAEEYCLGFLCRNGIRLNGDCNVDSEGYHWLDLYQRLYT
ncbi:CotS family spore coat protein [Heliobacillus mobilis]|uniref:CotS family spore coat protein n=1 Tax=Heliobacterium mobile TaxID=28064 RepID=A0A6I3SMY9_HELMO|nr:CotS family spore coat protein [Heliobacterium mobile]MTV50126.1 CotS family spore coat protein [Heliobacterium mobile]